MMRIVVRLVVAAVVCLGCWQHAAAESAETKVLRTLKYHKGKVTLGGNLATVQQTPEYRYLDPGDTQTFLTHIWDYPALARGALGLLLPNMDPLLPDAWIIVLGYADTGHVSDADGDAIDGDKLLRITQDMVRAWKQDRAALGVESLDLIGWTPKPVYNKAAKAVHWGAHFRFGGKTDQLRYEIRFLGRQGVLTIRILADVKQAAAVERAVADLLKMVSFNPGNLHTDFNPSLDRSAGYGVAGLITDPSILR